MFLYTVIVAIVAVVLGIFLAVRTKKNESVIYSKLDKVGIITNILLTIAYVCLAPFYMVLGMLCEPAYEGILGALGLFISLLIASAALPCGIGLGLSVEYRKKGKSKQSFMIQFLGAASIVLVVALFYIFYGNLLSTIN